MTLKADLEAIAVQVGNLEASHADQAQVVAAQALTIADLQRQLAECDDTEPTPDVPVTAAVSATGVVNVTPDGGATVTIKNANDVAVYVGGDGGGSFGAGVYTWAAVARTGHVLTGTSNGTFTVAQTPPPPTGDDIPPGKEVTPDGLIAALQSNGNGQVFRVKPGTSTAAFGKFLKPGQQVWGLEGFQPYSGKMPKFNGNGASVHAVESSGGESGKVPDVVLAYLEFEKWDPTNPAWVEFNITSTTIGQARKKNVIRGKTFSNLQLRGLHIHDCGEAIEPGSGTHIIGGLFDWNTFMYLHTSKVSFKMTGGWEAHNTNRRRSDGKRYHAQGYEVGCKLIHVFDSLIEDGFSHHNGSAGFWSDGADNRNITHRRLKCNDNDHQGIHYELAQGSDFIDCEARRNAGAGDLYISNSAGTATKPIRVTGGLYGPHDPVGVKAGIALKDNPGRSPRLAHVKMENVTIDKGGGNGIHVFGAGGTKPASVTAVNCKDLQGNPVNISVGG